MMLLPEEERVKTLDLLKQNLAKVISELASFPLSITTPSRQRRKQELETQVDEIEQAIDMFSRKKVLIAMSS